jgi:hypothetical protein
VQTAARCPRQACKAYDQAIVPNKYLYSRITVSGPTIAATKNNADAFVQAVSSEIDGATRDMKRSMNRQLHSDGSDALASGPARTTPRYHG